MLDVQLISTIVGISIGLGTLIAGMGYAYSQYKTGGDKYKDSLIETLKESIAVLEEKNKKQSEERSMLLVSHQKQLTELTTNLGILQGRFDELSKKAEEYKMILQGRDPEQLKMLTEIKLELERIKKVNV